MDMPFPRRSERTIDRRIKRLDEEQKKCLECASIIGSHIDLDILVDLMGRTKLSIIETLDRLCRERSLLIERDNVFLFSHDKVRQAILEGMTVNRRMELNQMVGKILETKAITESIASRLSYHFLIAGDRQRVTKYSSLAGDFNLRRSAAIEAIMYFNRALDNFEGDDALKDIILEKRGDAFKDLGNFDEAMNSYSSLLEKEGNIPKARILRKTAELYVPTRLGKGGAAIALKMLDEAEKENISDPYERGEIASDRATLELWMGNPKESLRYCMMAEDMFVQAGTEIRLALEKIESSTVLASTATYAIV